MDQPRTKKNPIAVALYVNAALLAAVLVALLARADGPTLVAPAFGQVQQPAIAGGAGLFVVPAQFSTNTWGCYLMDVDSQTLCAYQYVPGERQLRLVAARNFAYDRRLTNFNTGEPSPKEVQELYNKQQAAARGASPAPTPAPAPQGAPVAPLPPAGDPTSPATPAPPAR
ncbi:MAG TPA: hypothetical protein VER17_01495 [Tepidisphaeraceae bacterium]|nr:hypothetical protein [Tepidisphaeraceae bacterium]